MCIRGIHMCDYQNILGRPGEGIHTHVGGVAIADVAMTVGIAAMVAHATNYSFIIVLIFLLIIATALHYVFCVPTAGMIALGLANSNVPLVT